MPLRCPQPDFIENYFEAEKYNFGAAGRRVI